MTEREVKEQQAELLEMIDNLLLKKAIEVNNETPK